MIASASKKIWQKHQYQKERNLFLKKKELLFIGAILVLALVLWGISALQNHDYGSIRITVNGKEYGIYSLSEDQTISINDTNICQIQDGKAFMIEATCPDHLCMEQSAVDQTGGTIICLPNKVVIEGETAADAGEDSLELDAVT
jgi:hypothetical protein